MSSRTVQNESFRQAIADWLHRALAILEKEDLPSTVATVVRFENDGNSRFVDEETRIDFKRLVHSCLSEVSGVSIDEIIELAETYSEVGQLMVREIEPVYFDSPTGPAVRAPKNILKQFLEIFLERATAPRFDEEAFNTTCRDLEQYLFEPSTIQVMILVGLLNVDFKTKDIELGSTATLRQATPEEQAHFVASTVDAGAPSWIDAPGAVVEMLLTTGDKLPRSEFLKQVWTKPKSICVTVLMALRLIAPNYLAEGPYWARSLNPFYTLHGDFSFPTNQRTLPGEHFVVTDDTAATVKDLWADITKAMEDEALKIPFSRLSDTYERTKAADILIDFWIALESLFLRATQKEDLTEIAASAISFYLGRNAAERDTVYSEVKRCYAIRSNTVHGERPAQGKASEKGFTIDWAAERSGQLARQAMLKRIREL